MDSHARDEALAAELADLRWLGQLALRLVTDPSVADDACQEAWLAASRGGTVTVDRRGLVQALRSFLWRTRRAERRRRRREAEAVEPASFPSTAAVIEADEQRQRVWKQLTRLGEPFRSTLILRYQEDYSTAVIAERQGLPVDTVRWRLRRGLELLRESLERDRAGGGLSAVALAIPTSIRESTLSLAAVPATALLGIGVLTMAKFAAALILGVVTLYLLVDRAPPAAPAAASTELAAVGGATERLPERSAAVAAGAVDPEPPARRAPAEGGPAAVEAAPPALLTGRVVDSGGAPRAGIEVTFAIRDRSVVGASGFDGSFELELPQVDAPQSTLSFSGPATTERSYRRFEVGDAGIDAQPATAPGSVTDLGDLVLGDACVVVGRVVDAEARPVEGVRVFVSGSRKSRSDADGNFRAEHVRLTSGEVRLRLGGFLDRSVGFEPLATAVVDVGEVVLAAGPWVSGRVVDKRGEPIATARVRTNRWLRDDEVPVDDEGRFEIQLNRLDDPTLTATAPGYAEPYFAIPVRPGSDDVVIELRDGGEVCRVRIVDDASGEPLPFVHFKVDGIGGSYRGGAPQSRLVFEPQSEQSTDDGWIAFRAEPGESVVDVAAYGYASAAAVVAAEPAEGGQVIRLRRPRGLVGRVVLDGAPVEGAVVLLSSAELGVLEPARDGLDAIDPAAEHPLYDALRNQQGFSMTTVRIAEPAPDRPAPAIALAGGTITWTPGQRTATTGPDGRFHFANVEPRGHQLVARSADGALAARSELFYGDGSGVELGDLELRATGRISGRIVTADQSNLAGHRVRIFAPEPLEASTDASGRFELEGLSAGPQILFVGTTDEVHNASWYLKHFVSVAPGETRAAELVIDAVASAEVALEVTLDGEPLAGEYFVLTDSDQETDEASFDAHGRAVLHAPAGRPLLLEVNLGDWSRVRVGDWQSFPVGRTELRFDFESAACTIDLPADLEMPSDALVLLHWTDEQGREQRPVIGTVSEVDGIRASFPRILGGAQLTAVELARGRRWSGRRELQRWSIRATVQPGDALELAVE